MGKAGHLLRILALVWFVGSAVAGDWKGVKFEVGYSTHLPTNEGLDLIAKSGVSTVRDDIRWEYIEAEKDRLVMHPNYERYVDESLKRGLQPLLILDYGNPHYDSGEHPRSPEAIAGYVRFCEFVVKHFRGRVFRYEIWNEWNGATDMAMAGAADYVTLLAASYRAIKKIAPEVTVIGGVMSGNGLRNGWLGDACDAGMLYFLDGLSFHPYCWGAPCDERLPELGLVKRVRDLETFIGAYPRGRTVPLYISELGWPTHFGQGATTKEEAGDFFARSALLLAAMPRMRGMWWYGFTDDGEERSEWINCFGVVTTKLVPKPAYASATQVAEFLRHARGHIVWTETANTRSVNFRDRRGRAYAAAWTLQGRETVKVFARANVAGQRVIQRTTTSPALDRSWDRSGRRSMLRVTVGTQPTFLIPSR